MTLLADITPLLPLSGALAALVAVLATLLVSGARAERDRRRALYARALQAINAYFEMPFAIRRRRWEADERSAERVRLSDRFSEVQSELSTCQALMHADGDTRLAALYDELIEVTRTAAGGQARDAWEAEPISTDREVNLPAVRAALAPVATKREEFVKAIEEAGSYLWQWQRP